jgi:2-iminoacetate synthase ThiH
VHQQFHVNDIKRLIREAGRVPVERDTLYREISRDAEDRAEQCAPALAH